MTPSDPDTKYRVQSVDRAIDILEALAGASAPLTITEIADSVGGSKSGIFATVQTLVARGFVASAGTGSERRYSLGTALARLGEEVLKQVSFSRLARQVLRGLSEKTGLTSRAATWGGDCAIMIDRVDGRDGLRFDLQMGKREPLHRSSVGKAMLSAMNDEAVRDILDGLILDANTEHSLTTVAAVLDDVRRSRPRGYATDDEEDALGIICIGAPVLDHRGDLAGALSITRLKAGLDLAGQDRIGRTVAASAAELSQLLGYKN
jgi:IclR family transcriptional regulator, acetate operon repressor